ncbi:hypothetical protein D8666_19590 [Ochrobactrum soli]|uniref:hypothetical protein n=1 Tax=Ochrobactrum soli TaxID=2448455 RepID=UPI000EF243AF|nr:hypothetical protein [[Ochrobactrum] soli]RLL71669.1 hypothetical protein D8666_19590 [[Ochrobactrum] soli]
MPSKELIEKVATVLNEQEGCYFQPQDYHRGAAKEVIATIRAALQEPTERMLDASCDAWSVIADPDTRENMDMEWRAMLAASALGEQSE